MYGMYVCLYTIEIVCVSARASLFSWLFFKWTFDGYTTKGVFCKCCK